MSAEIGIVTRAHANGTATVVADRGGSCSGCSASHCCNPIDSTEKMAITASNAVGASPGDVVSLSIASGAIYKGAALMYLLPMAGVLVGVLAGNALAAAMGRGETPLAMLGGALGFGGAFVLAKRISARLASRGEFMPTIKRIVEKADARSLLALDPVCQMQVNMLEAAATCEWNGTVYYFCHPHCKDTFLQHPEQYI